MKPLDRCIQRWRIVRAARFIADGARVLDIGCADGALFMFLGSRMGGGIGIDPDAPEGANVGRGVLHRGSFLNALPPGDRFDVITLLAVLEHIAPAQQRVLAQVCYRCLRPGGRVVATVPSPLVDHILQVLRWLRLIDGMALEQHYGFRPAELAPVFESAGFRLERRRRFQFGLNNLFVFARA